MFFHTAGHGWHTWSFGFQFLQLERRLELALFLVSTLWPLRLALVPYNRLTTLLAGQISLELAVTIFILFERSVPAKSHVSSHTGVVFITCKLALVLLAIVRIRFSTFTAFNGAVSLTLSILISFFGYKSDSHLCLLFAFWQARPIELFLWLQQMIAFFSKLPNPLMNIFSRCIDCKLSFLFIKFKSDLVDFVLELFLFY